MTEPADALLRFISRLQRLEALPRTGWLVAGVVAPESIAAHVHEVALIAMWIADHLDEPVDTERVLRIALLHDVSESLTTDVPKPVKELFGEEAFAAAERRATDIVLAEAPPEWRDHLTEYEARTTVEARIVKAADGIQMFARALAYQAAANGDTRRFQAARPPDHGLALVREIIDRLEALRDGAGWFVADFD
mgnify:CR=1 FL=1